MTDRLSWTQPMCDECWARKHPRAEPVRLTKPEPEFCSYCGAWTEGGLYVRADPSTVPFPMPKAGP